MKFISKVQDSSLDLFGRILLLIAVCVGIYFANTALQSNYKPEAPYIIQLFITSFFICVGAVGFTLAYVVLIVIFTAFGWVFTGEFGDEVWDFANGLLKYVVVFPFMFIFGDWNRQWLKKKEKQDENCICDN